jgi:hypothetical protein
LENHSQFQPHFPAFRLFYYPIGLDYVCPSLELVSSTRKNGWTSGFVGSTNPSPRPAVSPLIQEVKNLGLKPRPKYQIPNIRTHSKTHIGILIMVFHVVLLYFLKPSRLNVGMVGSIMQLVVQQIAQNKSSIKGCCKFRTQNQTKQPLK